MAFGAGALLFALTIEIVAHSFEQVGFAPLAIGALLGGIFFELLNQSLNTQGAFLRKAATMARHVARLKRRQADTVLSRLGKLQILHQVSPEVAARLVTRVRALNVASGESVCSEGDPGEALYLIDSGELEASRGGQTVARLRPGEAFGEIALVTGAPRTATVKAVESSTLFVLSKIDFEELLRGSAEVRRRIGTLVEERSGDLVAHSLVSREEAEGWVRACSGFLTERDLSPTSQDMRRTARAHGAAALGIWLGILLDGIPESLVIGTSTGGFGSFSWALLAGVFMANLPEAMSSSVVMRSQAYSRGKILAMWSSITLLTGVGALLGSTFLRGMSHGSFAIIEGAAAGAMLTMIAETMLPEAYEQGGAVVGLSTLLGFLAALLVKAISLP
jgi:CRP-like cAMP-binding protein